MIYWKPELIFAENLEPSKRFVEQFGGFPWGLPEEKWPNCAYCGSPMGFVVQLQHHPKRLDLGKEGRVLYLFMCMDSETDCWIRDHPDGASQVLFLEQNERISGRTCPPDTLPLDHTMPECRVIGWKEEEDGIPEALKPFYVSNQIPPDLPDLSDEEWGQLLEEFHWITRLGSIPAWLQNVEVIEGFRFVGQIADELEISSPITGQLVQTEGPRGLTHWHIITERSFPLWVRPLDDAHSRWELEFGNGIIYLFVRPDPKKPEGKIVWQCT